MTSDRSPSSLSKLRRHCEANSPMPTPMPTGGRSQSVAVALTVPFVFRRRSRAGPVGLRTLSGNAVGGVTRHEGSNPSRSGFRLSDKAFGPPMLNLWCRSRLITRSSDANGDADHLELSNYVLLNSQRRRRARSLRRSRTNGYIEDRGTGPEMS